MLTKGTQGVLAVNAMVLSVLFPLPRIPFAYVHLGIPSQVILTCIPWVPPAPGLVTPKRQTVEHTL